jgi:hypothetical protein
MQCSARLVKKSQNITRVCLIFLIIFLIVLIIAQHAFVSYELLPTPSSNLLQYDEFCWHVSRQMLFERSFDNSQHVTSRNESIPYSYNHWHSSLVLPRPLTSCDHALFIHLLSVLIKNVFEKYNISYMIMAGTLIGSYFLLKKFIFLLFIAGSYTHHDIIPWDDDVDLSVVITDRRRFQSIIRSELLSLHSIEIMQIYNTQNYDKVFFTWCPFAGKYH